MSKRKEMDQIPNVSFSKMAFDDRIEMLDEINKIMMKKFNVCERDVVEMWNTLTFGTNVRILTTKLGDPSGDKLIAGLTAQIDSA